jgi:hypothetical protein
MRLAPTHPLPLLLPAVLVTVGLAATTGTAPASAAFGPPQKSCKKLSGPAKTSCQRSNQAARMAFDAIKDARFVGQHPHGAAIDATFCASGAWKVDVVVGGTPLSFSGPRWRLTDASRRSPKSSWISALATGPSRNIFTRIGLQRRGKTWVLSTRNNWTTPAPAAERTSAKDACAAL